jgi:hypothetical protein
LSLSKVSLWRWKTPLVETTIHNNTTILPQRWYWRCLTQKIGLVSCTVLWKTNVLKNTLWWESIICWGMGML